MKLHHRPMMGTLAIAMALVAVPAIAKDYAAELAGHAILPAATFVPPPADAPESFAISGRFAEPAKGRNETVGSIKGTSFLSDKNAPRETGMSLPFKGQPVQGFSGIKKLANGNFIVLTDNGFGSKANSSDAMLMFHELRVDWAGGKVDRVGTSFLHDPDRKLPFVIVNEHTPKRYLTGADLDIESIQPIGDSLWFGDEFGPYLVRTDLSGKVTGFFETKVDGKLVRSPDHYALTPPAMPGPVAFEVRRSRGFEGMAASVDGKFLYPLLEGPLWDAAAKAWETKDGREYLRILEFDVAKGEYTGRSWKYRLELNDNNIGDFNMIDADTGLIIERDNGEGDPATACNGPAKPDCQNVPAKFKRIYKIDLAQADAEDFVKKIGFIDLMNIADPKALARVGGKTGTFTFPFVTIEDVAVVDADHIIVANDNNLPYSSGRQIGKQDDNEFILLRVPEFLRAK